MLEAVVSRGLEVAETSSSNGWVNIRVYLMYLLQKNVCGCGHMHGCVYHFVRWNHFSYYWLKSDVVTGPLIVVRDAATVVYCAEHFSRPLLLSAHTVSQESCTANSQLPSDVTVGLAASTFFERPDGVRCVNKSISVSACIVVYYTHVIAITW